MFPTPLSNSVIPLVVRSQLRSPAVTPILGHALREVLAPTLLASRGASSKAVAPVGPSDVFSELLRPHFAPHSFFHDELVDYARRWNDFSDLRRERLFSSPGHSITMNDSGNVVKVAMDLPGVKIGDVTVELKNDKLLHISGERRTESGDAVEHYKFDKKFDLGKNLDHENITASLSEGVLTISAPVLKPVKKENVKAIRVTIPEKPLDEFDESDDIEATKNVAA